MPSARIEVVDRYGFALGSAKMHMFWVFTGLGVFKNMFPYRIVIDHPGEAARIEVRTRDGRIIVSEPLDLGPLYRDDTVKIDRGKLQVKIVTKS